MAAATPPTPPALTTVQEKRVKTAIKFLRDQQKPLVKDDVVWLLKRLMPIFQKQPMLIEIEPPLCICGDIHGQLIDLLRLFEVNGWPPKMQYLFLGDYVDRGPKNTEVISLMFALKARYPTRLHLLRGNHETRAINEVYGFKTEVDRIYPPTGDGADSVYELFNDVFDWMPLSALVAGKILCMHGGFGPTMKSLDQIRGISRPLVDVPPQGIVADLLWADPDKKADKNPKGFIESSRGISYLFGERAVADLCEMIGLDMVARAHQVVDEGFEFFCSEKLVTLFTAPDYCDQFTNSGGVMFVAEDLTCEIRQLPSKTKMPRASIRANC